MRNIQIPPALTLVIGYDLWLTTYADRALAVYAVYAAAVLTLVRESALDQLLDQGRRRGSQEPLLLLLLAIANMVQVRHMMRRTPLPTRR